MHFEVFAIGTAFVFGLIVRQVGLPPLVGFLAAGFFINFIGPGFGMPVETGPILDYVAELGVLILLFTIGLKLKIRQITEPQVIGGALIHFAVSVALFTPIIWLLFTSDWLSAALIGIALAFSSTVLSAKILEAKRELGTFHGRTAIGILIVQDIIALVVLAIFVPLLNVVKECTYLVGPSITLIACNPRFFNFFVIPFLEHNTLGKLVAIGFQAVTM